MDWLFVIARIIFISGQSVLLTILYSFFMEKKRWFTYPKFLLIIGGYFIADMLLLNTIPKYPYAFITTTILISFGLAFILFHGFFAYKLFIAGLAAVYTLAIEILVDSIFFRAIGEPISEFFSHESSLILFGTLICVGLQMIILLLIYPFRVGRLHPAGKPTLYLQMCIFPLCTLSYTVLLIWQQFQYGGIDYDVVFFAAILLVLMISIYFVLYQRTEKLQEQNYRHRIESEEFRIREEYYQIIETHQEQLQALRHDMHNHFSNILVISKQLEKSAGGAAAAELSGYLQELGHTLEKTDLRFKTGHPITDVIVNGSAARALPLGIDFESNFRYPQNYSFESYDIATILNNLLDNAMEANMRLETNTTRYMRLSSEVRGRMFFIRLSNSFDGIVLTDRSSGLLATLKPDKSSHGIGLANIRRTAEKYDGQLNIQQNTASEPQEFQCTVMLQRKKN